MGFLLRIDDESRYVKRALNGALIRLGQNGDANVAFRIRKRSICIKLNVAVRPEALVAAEPAQWAQSGR